MNPAHNGYVYFEIWKGTYGFPRVVTLSINNLYDGWYPKFMHLASTHQAYGVTRGYQSQFHWWLTILESDM